MIIWAECDGVATPLRRATVDRIFCFSVRPHFPDPSGLARELWRILNTGGRIHIWHSNSRDAVIAIHRSAGPAIRGDHFPQAAKVESVLCHSGFRITESRDDEAGFPVNGVKVRLEP